MGHRQALSDDFIALAVDQHAAVASVISPAFGHIAGSDTGGIARNIIDHGHAVQMTSVFCRDAINERRPPDRRETAILREGRKTIKAGHDEKRCAVFADMHVMHVDITGRMGTGWHVNRIMTIYALYAGLKEIAKAPHLVAGAEPKLAVAHTKSHRAVECPLVDGHLAILVKTDGEDLPRLIGRENEASANTGKPCGEQAATAQA